MQKENSFYYGHEKERRTHCWGKASSAESLKDIIFSVKNIILNHMRVEQDLSVKELKKLIMELGKENLSRLFDLMLSKYEFKNWFRQGKEKVLYTD